MGAHWAAARGEVGAGKSAWSLAGVLAHLREPGCLGRMLPGRDANLLIASEQGHLCLGKNFFKNEGLFAWETGIGVKKKPEFSESQLTGLALVFLELPIVYVAVGLLNRQTEAPNGQRKI